ncbi:MAG: HNH endonuclease [Microthrixaceae bacterium]|nr:HNH endonuclease [Microthrixaceae bacterium]
MFSPTAQPVNITSPQRFFTGGWRRAVEIRDRHCQHPTCDVPAEYCHVDHITEHTDGGTTSIDNGRLLCPRHNHQRPGRRPPAARRSAANPDDDPDQPG